MDYKEKHYIEHNEYENFKFVRNKKGILAVQDLKLIKNDVFKLDMYSEGSFHFTSECRKRKIEIKYETENISVFNYETVIDILSADTIKYICIRLYKDW